jgi:hypothetical protein
MRPPPAASFIQLSDNVCGPPTAIELTLTRPCNLNSRELDYSLYPLRISLGDEKIWTRGAELAVFDILRTRIDEARSQLATPTSLLGEAKLNRFPKVRDQRTFGVPFAGNKGMPKSYSADLRKHVIEAIAPEYLGTKRSSFSDRGEHSGGMGVVPRPHGGAYP